MGGSNLKQPVSATAMERWPWAVRGLPHGRCGGCADLLDQAAEFFSAAGWVFLGCAAPTIDPRRCGAQGRRGTRKGQRGFARPRRRAADRAAGQRYGPVGVGPGKELDRKSTRLN